MFRAISIFLTCCVVLILAAPVAYRLLDSGNRSQRLLSDGLAQVQSGDWVQARLRFEEVLAEEPGNLQARLGLAQALRAGGLYETAATHLLNIIGEAPDMIEARIEFGEMLFLAGQMEESRAQLAKALEIGSPSPRADALAAAHAAEQGDYAMARELAEAALASDPALSSAYATLAAAALREGSFDTAIEALDRARNAHAETLPLALLRLGIYEKNGRMNDIGRELAELSARHPDLPELRLALARWLASHQPGSELAANDVLAGLLREHSGDQAMVSDLTEEIVDLLGVAGAREVFDLATLTPELEGAFDNQIAILETASGDRETAIARLERAIDEDGSAETRNTSRLILARILDPVEELERRNDLASVVLATDPANASAHLLLADADMRRGAYARAISHLRAALSVRPDSTEIILRLAQAHALAGSLELAQDELSKAVRVSEQSPPIALRYAQVIEKRQGKQVAADLVSIALEAHPDNRDLLVRRAQLALDMGDLNTARSLADRLATVGGSAEVTTALNTAIAAQSGQIEATLTRLEGAWQASGGESELLSLGEAYLRSGRVAKALDLLDGLLAAQPDWATALLMRADAHLAGGDFEAAEADLSRAADLTPENASLQAGLARLRLALKRADAADAAIAQGLAATPGDYELLLLKAFRDETRGDQQAATEGYCRLSRLNPGDMRVASRLGAHPADTDPSSREAELLPVQCPSG